MSTSGKYRQRRFDELEVGKSYIANCSGDQVKIVEWQVSGLFLGDNGVYYTKTGRVTTNKRWNRFEIYSRYSEDLVVPATKEFVYRITD
jgi:hypothetical protein